MALAQHRDHILGNHLTEILCQARSSGRRLLELVEVIESVANPLRSLRLETASRMIHHEGGRTSIVMNDALTYIR